MPDNFDAACTYLIKNEGGSTYTDGASRPFDLGGPTRFGIILATLTAWRSLQAGRPVVTTAADVKALTEAEARAIYRACYWQPLRLSDVTCPAIAQAVFDMSAPVGVSAAARVLQACAQVKADGQVGPVTIAAVNAMEPEALLVAFSSGMMAYFRAIVRRLPDQKANLAGWLKRAAVLQVLYP